MADVTFGDTIKQLGSQFSPVQQAADIVHRERRIDELLPEFESAEQRGFLGDIRGEKEAASGALSEDIFKQQQDLAEAKRIGRTFATGTAFQTEINRAREMQAGTQTAISQQGVSSGAQLAALAGSGAQGNTLVNQILSKGQDIGMKMLALEQGISRDITAGIKSEIQAGLSFDQLIQSIINRMEDREIQIPMSERARLSAMNEAQKAQQFDLVNSAIQGTVDLGTTAAGAI